MKFIFDIGDVIKIILFTNKVIYYHGMPVKFITGLFHRSVEAVNDNGNI